MSASRPPLTRSAHYANGELVAPAVGGSATPTPCAGVDGTTISAQNIFFNAPQRSKALRHVSEEYNRCVDVASRYAVHFGGRGVGFTCKKVRVCGGMR